MITIYLFACSELLDLAHDYPHISKRQYPLELHSTRLKRTYEVWDFTQFVKRPAALILVIVGVVSLVLQKLRAGVLPLPP